MWVDDLASKHLGQPSQAQACPHLPAISISSNPSCAAKETSLALIREDKTLFAVEFMPPVESARPLTTASKEVT